ncbi:hypothetical protein ASE26_13200 [Duganella sp. Root198D2]|nr:hypothetical protein ASD07_20425 [Duganella sp. Root336D2]KRB83416.1 hypothetical protein ASE26_13200 [Duganella sp. Root198D2]
MPQSDLAERAGDETYMPKFFALNGRIGRVRYWSYSFLAGLLMMPVLFLVVVVGVLSGIMTSPGAASTMFGLLIWGMYLAITIILARRRFHDMGKSGWLSILAIIPIVQIGIGLWLLFAPGDDCANDYGPQPAPNTTGVLVVAWIVPVLIVVGGILAAVSIPAYKDYTDRARAAQMQEGGQ